MPLHQNQDDTWQWGKSGKKYKKKQDAIKQMKAIFASGYVQKKATLNGYASNDTNNKGPMYMTYTDVYNMIKQAADKPTLVKAIDSPNAISYTKSEIEQARKDPGHQLQLAWNPAIPSKNLPKTWPKELQPIYEVSSIRPWQILNQPLPKITRDANGKLWSKHPRKQNADPTSRQQLARVMNNFKALKGVQQPGDHL